MFRKYFTKNQKIIHYYRLLFQNEKFIIHLKAMIIMITRTEPFFENLYSNLLL